MMNSYLRGYQICALFLSMLMLSRSTANVLFANLTGDAEVGYPAPVPESYRGTAEFTFEDLSVDRLSRIDYFFSQSGLDQILNVYLETPIDAMNGLVVIDFTKSINLTILQEQGNYTGKFLSNLNITLGMRQDPSMYYVSFKTKNYAAGAIRGPVVDLIPSAITGLTANAQVSVNMTWDQVVPRKGPENGMGHVSLNFFYLTNGSIVLRYDFMDVNITDIVSVGLYYGQYGVAGPLLIDLTPAIDLLAFDYNGFTGGELVVNPDTVFQILNDAAIVYCQIDTTEFPAGAVRGNLDLTHLTLPPPPGTPTPRAAVNYNDSPPPPSSHGVSVKVGQSPVAVFSSMVVLWALTSLVVSWVETTWRFN